MLASLVFNTACNHSANITRKILMKKELKKINSHVGFILESCSQIIAHLHNRLGLLICLEECSYVTLLHPPNYNYSHLDKKIFAYLNVPFSIASGKLMDQINYILKKINQIYFNSYDLIRIQKIHFFQIDTIFLDQNY